MIFRLSLRMLKINGTQLTNKNAMQLVNLSHGTFIYK